MSTPLQAKVASGLDSEGEVSMGVLVCRVRRRLCAIPLAHVVETMRPLPIEALTTTLTAVMGVAIIRGVPVPVVDPGSLLGTDEAPSPTRFVTVMVDGRRVALAVEEVVGVRDFPASDLEDLPPLLRDVGAEIISAVGVLDDALLIVLRATRLLSESTWNELSAAGRSS
jgi:purine-binding chemotaxis protein CheW